MRSFIENLLSKVLKVDRAVAFDPKPFGADANWVCQGDNC